LFGIPSDPEVVLLIANTIFLGFEVDDKRSAAAGGHWFFVMMELSFAAVFIGEWFIRLHHQRHLSMYNRATGSSDIILQCSKLKNKPTIWGWYLPSIYGNIGDFLIIGFTTLTILI
jgi:hypothetical protein